MAPPAPMRPRTSSRSPLTSKTATAPLLPLPAGLQFIAYLVFQMLNHLALPFDSPKKDRTAYPAKAGTEGAIKGPLGSQVHVRQSTGNVCSKRRRGLRRWREPATAAVGRTQGNSALICYDSAISTRELHRVTLHCGSEVSPLEIGGFGAVPPSPPK